MASLKKTPYQKRDIFFCPFLKFFLQDNKIKSKIEVIKLTIWPQKGLSFKRL